MIETVSRYPRRQWPVCPHCGSHQTLKSEVCRIDRFQCETCHYQWPPRPTAPSVSSESSTVQP